MATDLQQTLENKFSETFGYAPAIVSYAPGRIEVLGNHTDYNEGYVLSAAINCGTFFAISPRTDSAVRLVAGDIMAEVSFPVSAPERSEDHVWSNYVKGCLAGLNAAFGAPERGFDAMFLGNIPLGSGLSSSAALEVCATLAMAKIRGVEPAPLEVALIGQKAEHEFAGVKCGLLDQATSVFGEKDHLVMSDFRSREFKPVAFPSDVCFLMCNTHAKHALVDGAYNERRECCERAARFFAAALDHQVSALRDVSWAEWLAHRADMPELDAKRSAHPIGEDGRVLAGVEMLREGDVESFGRLMFESHDSSRNYFENSCPELDTVVDAAKAIPGVLGARLSGGGFGGSAVVLVRSRDAEAAAAAIRHAYAHKNGDRCDTRTVVCSGGARVVKGA
ncbi:MAG: galactokinase [Kiritimatiellae bacterium]|nr:galactokinase [Kiritimatiellia bacterium]